MTWDRQRDTAMWEIPKHKEDRRGTLGDGIYVVGGAASVGIKAVVAGIATAVLFTDLHAAGGRRVLRAGSVG